MQDIERSVTVDSGEHAEIHVFIGVSSTTLFSSAARFFTVTYPLPLNKMNLGVAPFDAIRPAFSLCDATILHIKGGVIGTGGVTVFIEADFLEGTFVAGVIRD